MKFLHVEEADYIEDYQVLLSFNDGSKRVADLSNSLNGPIFEPLRDKEYFKNFQLEGFTLSWDNGADFSPEYLHTISQQTA
jgi:hypothetical protein|tara:strand:- start:254 stop:496 length:243 start_codon:yes stop_codon:yes gene_type:complete